MRSEDEIGWKWAPMRPTQRFQQISWKIEQNTLLSILYCGERPLRWARCWSPVPAEDLFNNLMHYVQPNRAFEINCHYHHYITHDTRKT